MLILGVDTSSRTGSLAALRGGEILAAVSSNGGSGEPYSSLLFRDLDRLLGEAHLPLHEFDLFAVAAGPGSFTGLRVGLTSVKAWAELYNRPVAAVSGLEAIAAQAHIAEGQLIASVIDARRGQIYGGLYRALREPAMAPSSGNGGAVEAILQLEGDEVVMEAKPFLEMVTERAGGAPIEFISPVPEILEPAMQELRLCSSCVQKASDELAPVVGRLGYQKARRGQLIDALRLDANYVRRTDAELHWKGF